MTSAPPNDPTAQAPRARVAVFGAAHWHAPLYRDSVLRRHDVVAVQADDLAAVASPDAWGVDVVTDVDTVLDATPLDMAYVFSPHDEMAGVCHRLIELGIPFVVEKPAGASTSELAGVVDAARAAGVPATVAFVQRDAPVEIWLRQVGAVSYERLSFIAGPPSRYLHNGNPWMLDPVRAGGGSLVNLGPHFVDLALRHLGPGPTSSVTRSRALHETAVDDHATVVLTSAAGREAIIEVGYAYPSSPLQRYCSFTAAGEKGFASIDTDGTARFTGLDGVTTTSTIVVDSDPLYAVFVDRVADTLAGGFAGMPTLDDLAAAMQIVWADAGTTTTDDGRADG